MLILAPLVDSGTNSGELVTAAAAAAREANMKKIDHEHKKKDNDSKEERRSAGVAEIDPACSSSHTRDDLEPSKPQILPEHMKPPHGGAPVNKQ